MNGVRKVTEDLYWVGVNDKRIELFENIHPIPEGVSYNAYLLLDEKTVLFDTVDWSGCRVFLENIAAVLDGRKLHRIGRGCLGVEHPAKCIHEIFSGDGVVCGGTFRAGVGQAAL